MGSEKKKKKDKKHKSSNKDDESEVAGKHNAEDIVSLNSNFVTTEADNVWKKKKKKKKKNNETSSKTEKSNDQLRKKDTPDGHNETRNDPERGSENKRSKRKKKGFEVEESEYEARRHKKRKKHSHDGQSDAESVNIDSVKGIQRTEASYPECGDTKSRREHCISENSDSDDAIRVELEHNDMDSVILVNDDDSIDFEDEDYLIQSKIKYANSSSDDSDDDLRDLPIISCFPTYMEQTPSSGRNKLSFLTLQKGKKTFEEMLYKFPPGVGVPDNLIEEIPEKYDYWKFVGSLLPDQEQFSMKEAEEEIEDKIDVLCDYFERLESGRLIAEELQKKKETQDIHDLYLPIPEHIEFFENLEIKVTWPLSRLHEMCIKNPTRDTIKIALRKSDIQRNMTAFSTKEKNILLSNWRKFQKEYKFYDLRPLLTVRTHRLKRTQDDDIEFTRWKYLSPTTETAFGLYLARGLKDRSSFQAISCLRRLMPHLDKHDEYHGYQNENITARDIAKLEYMLHKFGNAWGKMEAVLGRCTKNTFISRFYIFLWQRHLKFRIGPWTKAEMERLKLGLFTELGVSSLMEVFEKGHFPYMKLLPYVKTRTRYSIRQFLQYTSKHGFFNSVNHTFKREDWIKLIDLVYQLDYEEDSHIQWEEVAGHFPGIDKFTVKGAFMDMYYKVPLKIRQNSFEDAKQYLYDHMRFKYVNMPQERGGLNIITRLQGVPTRGKGKFLSMIRDEEFIKSEDTEEIMEESTLDTSDIDEEVD